jgi:competence protein ComEC
MLLSLLVIGTFKPVIMWTAVHVSGENQSGDAHLLELGDGTVILIDTGFRKYAEASLIPLLRDKGITKIDHLVITHDHRNHYGGVLSLIDAGIKPQKVYFNLPPKESCAKENWPGGCSFQHILDTQEKLTSLGIPVVSMDAGQVILEKAKPLLKLTVLYAFDGTSQPANITVNDSSAVLKLVAGGESVLFTGDIGQKTGKYLARHGEQLQATIMTAPHHGVEVMAPNEFFDHVKPEVIIASISKAVLMGDRGERIRQYASEKAIPLYATGLHGWVEVIIDPDGYQVHTERQP